MLTQMLHYHEHTNKRNVALPNLAFEADNIRSKLLRSLLKTKVHFPHRHLSRRLILLLPWTWIRSQHLLRK